jgi:hypothetical protein
VGLDPTLVRGFQPTQNIGPNVGAMLQDANAMMQVDAFRKEQQRQNALRGILSQPGALDDQGNPTQDVMKQINAVDPAAGMTLQQNSLINQQRQLQLQSMKTKAFGEKMDMIGDAYAPLYETYQDAIKGGAPVEQATSQAQEGVTAALDRLKQSGMLTPQEVNNLPTQFDPIKMGNFVQGSKNYQDWRANNFKSEQASRKDQLERDKLDQEAQLRGRQLDIQQENVEAGRYTYAQGPGPGPDGKTVEGSWRYPTRGNEEPQFFPGVTRDAKAAVAGSANAERATRFEEEKRAQQDAGTYKNDSGVYDVVDAKLKSVKDNHFPPGTAKVLVERALAGDFSGLTGFGRSPALLVELDTELAKQMKEHDPPLTGADLARTKAGYAAYVQGTKAFEAGGKLEQPVRSLSVAVDHLDLLKQAATALAQHNIAMLNRLENPLRTEFGYSGPPTFDAIKGTVAAEIEKAVSGGHGAVSDREDLKKSLNRSLPPPTLLKVIDGYQGLMSGQLNGFRKSYQRLQSIENADGGDFDKKFLSDRARAVLEARPSGDVLERRGQGGGGSSTKQGATGSDGGAAVLSLAGGIVPAGKPIPQKAIDDLKAATGTAGAFDKTFGAGAAARILGGTKGGAGASLEQSAPQASLEQSAPQASLEQSAAQATTQAAKTATGPAATTPGNKDEGAKAAPQAAKPAQAHPALREGATATNPKTGARIVVKDGKWVPMAPTVPFKD